MIKKSKLKGKHLRFVLRFSGEPDGSDGAACLYGGKQELGDERSLVKDLESDKAEREMVGEERDGM